MDPGVPVTATKGQLIGIREFAELLELTPSRAYKLAADDRNFPLPSSLDSNYQGRTWLLSEATAYVRARRRQRILDALQATDRVFLLLTRVPGLTEDHRSDPWRSLTTARAAVAAILADHDDPGPEQA